ncbi:MAG: ferrous iron transport protein A [Candidatus Omnitrophica bacterium]|nr:ferrous iron transport protein A [Candidatus Omnitrophota bacterium]
MSKEKIKTIADMMPKEKGRVLKISGKAQLRRRLLDMGILPGALVEMVRHAPLGDPIDLKIKGYHLSLRKSEAAHITIKKAGS